LTFNAYFINPFKRASLTQAEIPFLLIVLKADVATLSVMKVSSSGR
jgi:hypothetical protein